MEAAGHRNRKNFSLACLKEELGAGSEGRIYMQDHHRKLCRKFQLPSLGLSVQIKSPGCDIAKERTLNSGGLLILSVSPGLVLLSVNYLQGVSGFVLRRRHDGSFWVDIFFSL